MIHPLHRICSQPVCFALASTSIHVNTQAYFRYLTSDLKGPGHHGTSAKEPWHSSRRRGQVRAGGGQVEARERKEEEEDKRAKGMGRERGEEEGRERVEEEGIGERG